jgi:hypothetical protein
MRKAGFVILMLLMSGCASRGGIRPLKAQELAISPYQEVLSSRLTGSLMYERGCLLFREDETKARYLPIWPEGSIFNGTSVIYHQPAKSEQRIVVGEEVQFEGRVADWATLSNYYAPFSRQCGGRALFVSRVRPAD